jgi:hypothetical protein
MSHERAGKEISFPFDQIKLIYMKQKSSIFSNKVLVHKIHIHMLFFFQTLMFQLIERKPFHRLNEWRCKKIIFFTTHAERLIEGRNGEDVVIEGSK